MKKRTLLFAMGLGIALSNYSQTIDGSWKGKLKLGAQELNIVFNLKRVDNGGYSCSMDSPDQGAKGIPAVANLIDGDSINIDIPMIKANYGGKITDKSIKGRFVQSGMTFNLDLSPGELVRNRPQTPTPPFNYKTQEVSFENKEDKVILSGTLTYPTNYNENNKENTPVVLLITGSGSQNRDQELFEHKPFLVLADYLAQHGVASLRYDDRGIGKSTGDPNTITIMSNYRDAQAGIKLLKDLKHFGKIGVIGHSEGGTLAFMLGSQESLDFIISMAGAAISGKDILIEQNRALMSSYLPLLKVEDYCSVLSEILSTKSSKKSIPDPLKLIDDICTQKKIELSEASKTNLYEVAKMNNPWLDSFISLDPSSYISKIKMPLFALGGTNDKQVIAESNLLAVKRLVPHNPKNKIKTYENLNHLFQNSKTGAISEYSIIEETILPIVLEDIANWINESIK
ncbi:MAG: alpha/beta hydrolase family protein [Bacteroidales bacterium]